MDEAMKKCGNCRAPVGKVHYEEVRGWAKTRDAGGTNAIKLRELTGRVLCSACMLVLSRRGQQSLM